MKKETLNQRVNNLVKEEKAMRVGDIVRVIKCGPMPEVVGQRAEIVDLQMQEYEMYCVYPVWVKMLTGERQGKVCGFHYAEIEVVERKAETKVATELEDILAKADEIKVSVPMKVGDTVKIGRCKWKPELVGESVEIVDLQMQEYEKYRVYPVWVKMLTSERQGKVYGFNYNEVEVVEKKAKMGVIVELEEILRNATSAEDIKEIETVTKDLIKEERKARVGDTVTITNCVPVSDLAGERAEVVDLQTQEFERYRAYPVWLKISSGERKGKVYGFQLDEVEWLAKHEVQTAGHKIVKTHLAAEIERIIRDANTFEEIAEIERAINEAKGRIMLEPALGFWEGKTPCWEMFRCPEAVRNECPAFHYRSLPCWQIEGTYSKLHAYGTKGECTRICENCRVYKRYGNAEPIEIKLRGKGFNRAPETATK
jgi:ribosomal protein S17